MVRKWSCRMYVCFSRARWKFLKLHQCQVILFLTLKKRLVLAVVFLSGFFFFLTFCSFIASESKLCPPGWICRASTSWQCAPKKNQSYRLYYSFCPPRLTDLTRCENKGFTFLMYCTEIFFI